MVVSSCLLPGAAVVVPSVSPAPDPQTLDGAAEPADAKVVVTPNGVVLPVLEATDTGWLVSTPCQNEVELPLSGGQPVAEATVVLDPGHGGREPGAVSAAGLTEKSVNLNVAREVKGRLEAQGISVLLTRGSDVRMPLVSRAEIVNVIKPDLFVSIHHNAGTSRRLDGPGTEIYFQISSVPARRLSGLIYEEGFAALSERYPGVPWVGALDAGPVFWTDPQGEDYLGMLRRTKGTPAVLTEFAYLSNPAEAAIIATPEFQRLEADSISRGIVRWMQTKDPGSGYKTVRPRGVPGSSGGTANCVDPPFS